MSTELDEEGPDPTSQALLRLIPRFGPVVATWRQETHERQQRRAEQLGAVAAEDLGAERLFKQLASDERLTDMFNAAVGAAIATSSDAKIRLLGRVLAAGAVARDEAKVDEVEQLLRIALELDPVDLRAMRALERWRSRDAEATVAYALDVEGAIAGPIVARLVRLNLLSVERTASVLDKKDPEDDQVEIQEEWTTTSTAGALLLLLRQRAELHGPDSERPAGATWAGFTEAQAALLEKRAEFSKFDWRLQPQPDEGVARTLAKLDVLGLPYPRVRQAMRSIGFSRHMLDELDRWVATPMR